MTSRRLRRFAPLPLAALALAAGCGSAKPATTDASDPSTTVLQSRAALAATLTLVGSYDVTDTAGVKATAKVWITPTAYRVDVVTTAVTASLYGTAQSTVACTTEPTHPTACYTVAGAGKPVPAVFDAGVERVFTRDLPALAQGAAAFSVTPSLPSADVASLGTQVTCYQVARLPGSAPLTDALAQLVDEGTYCLGIDGVPVQLTFTSGTLRLTSRGGVPTAADLQVPVSPKPLPAGLPTGEPTTSTAPLLPTIAGSAAPTANGSPVR